MKLKDHECYLKKNGLSTQKPGAASDQVDESLTTNQSSDSLQESCPCTRSRRIHARKQSLGDARSAFQTEVNVVGFGDASFAKSTPT